MTANPILQAALLIGAGTVGAIIARAVRIPLAAGSLIAAGTLSWGASFVTDPATMPGQTFLSIVTLSFVGLLAGVSIDLSHLISHRARLLAGLAARAIVVFGSVLLTGLALGMTLHPAALLASAATALSPAAVAAVTSELRSRGDLTRDLLLTAPVSLLLALAATLLIVAPAKLPSILGSIFIAGALAGIVLILPISRMARRGSILAASAIGAVLLAGVASYLPTAGVVAMLSSIIAGFMMGNLIPNRAIVRDALADMGTPAVIVMFALVAPVATAPGTWALLPAAMLVVGARLAGTIVPGIVAGRGARAVAEGAARLPMAGLLVAPALTVVPPGALEIDRRLIGLILLAGALSEVAGMTMMRWTFISTGEAAGRDDPDAWRATMR